MPHLRAVNIIGRVRTTYIATSVEHEICVFRFGQVDWTVRKAVGLAAGSLPYERRGFIHQELSKRFACACKVEEVYGVDVCGKLSPSRPSANGRNTTSIRVQGTTRRGSVGIFPLAFPFAASWEPPCCHLVGASLLVMGNDFPEDVRQQSLS